MLRAIKYELCPNATRRSLINGTCGCCRFVYNNALTFARENIVSNSVLIKRIPQLKEEYEWLKEVPSQAQQPVLCKRAPLLLRKMTPCVAYRK